MQIKVTKTCGVDKLFNGDIEYHDTYVVIRYRNLNHDIYNPDWVEIAIPWRLIHEIEVKP